MAGAAGAAAGAAAAGAAAAAVAGAAASGFLAAASLLAAAAWVPYRFWERAAWPMLCATWLLLVLILVGGEAIAPEVNGARRWLRIGAVALQPSELAKFAPVV